MPVQHQVMVRQSAPPRLVARDRRAHTPVLATRNFVRPPVEESGYKLGANSYLRKPVDSQQVAAAVRRLGLYSLVLTEVPTVPPTALT
jgi:two-component system response regulator